MLGQWPGDDQVISWREARACCRLLLERGWLFAVVGAIALSVVFTLLGRWQYGRHETKVARNERIEANYDAAPVPLAEVLSTPADPPAPGEQWTPVSVTGEYLTDRTVLVRNRPFDGVYGFEVLVPLRVLDGSGDGAGWGASDSPSGDVLLVDRGWVPNGPTGAAPDRVPDPPRGRVELVARLRPSEPGLDRTPPAGQQLRIDLPRIARQLGEPLGERLYQAYGVLDQETPAAADDETPGGGVLRLPRPDEDLGPHLAYAVQWWAFALACYGVLGHYLLREVRLRAGTLVPSATRRRRNVDEEWEDRVLD